MQKSGDVGIHNNWSKEKIEDTIVNVMRRDGGGE